MPPDITAGLNTTAGLIALAGLPPSAAAPGKPATGPPAAEPLSASLFAAFLAQSGKPATVTPKPVLPNEAAAAPKQAFTLPAGEIPALPRVVRLPVSSPPLKPFLDTRSLPAEPLKTIPLPLTLDTKTMDTLPKISTLPAGKVKDKTSELLLPHKAFAETAALPNVLPPAAPGAVQAVVLPAVLPAPPLVLGIATPSIALSTAPVLVAANPVTPTGKALLSRQFLSVQAAPVPSAPVLGSLPLPRTFALTAPVLSSAAPAPAVPLLPAVKAASAPAVGSDPLPAPNPGNVPVTKAFPGAAPAASPKAAGLPQNVPPAPKLPLPAAPPAAEAVPATATMPVTAPVPVFATVPSLPQPLMAVSTAVLPALVPDQESPKPVTGKLAGKSPQITLKPGTQNADSNTRTLPVEVPAVTAKTVAAKPAAMTTAALVIAQEPGAPAEKHSETQEAASDTLGTGAALLTQSADAAVQEAKIDKPLSAADHAEIVRQVAGELRTMPLPREPGAAQQMSLQLHPKDWGSLQVSVTVAASQEVGAAKTVTAHIVAETPQVKAALQSQTGALHEALRASGLHLEHLTVSVKAPEVKAAEAKSAEAKAPEVKPATPGTSAGLSSGLGQPKQNESSASGQPAASSQYGALGTSAGSSQNGRQGQPPPLFTVAALAEPEPGDNGSQNLLKHSVSSRIDMHA